MTDAEKKLLKDNSKTCVRCGKTFEEGETKCVKTLDYRDEAQKNETSFAVLCRDCNYLMYDAEKNLNLKTEEIVARAKRVLIPLIELFLQELAHTEASAIVDYSKNIKSSYRPSLDKLYCGIHRWKTNADLAKLLEIADWIGIERENSKHIAAEIIKKKG